MHPTAALVLLLALAACRIDRTPQELIDPMNPALVDRREAEGEVAARVGAFRESLARGAPGDAMQALQPLPDAHVIGVDDNEGRPRFGADGIEAALAEIPAVPGSVVRMPDLRVQTDPRERLAWFATHVEVVPVVGDGGAAERLRLSGVFQRQEAEWRLVHLHLSRAAGEEEATRPPAPPREAADEATPGDG